RLILRKGLSRMRPAQDPRCKCPVQRLGELAPVQGRTPVGLAAGRIMTAPRASRAGLRASSAWLALLTCAIGLAPRIARAQAEVRFFHGRPIRVTDTGGPHAPVRSLVWQDGFTLITAGEDKAVKVWSMRDGPRLVQTIRPSIWRGFAGSIF